MMKKNMLGDNSASAREAFKGLKLIPWPKNVDITAHEKVLTFPENMRVINNDCNLSPLAEVMTEEITAVFRKEVSVADNEQPASGDIILNLDPELKTEEYQLTVADYVEISGGDYAGVAAGTVTLLQSLISREEDLNVPIMEITDAPYASYRSLMVDPARDFHSIETLKHMVKLCRWYKIRYLHLHLTDGQSFTFPSRAYPDLPTPGRHYTVEQLRDLEKYAIEHGVIILPELDVPGHSDAAVKAMPELFATKSDNEKTREKTLNFVNPEACRAVDTIIGEMCDVFRATPYFHIGSDECRKEGLEKDPAFQTAMKDQNLPNAEELYRKFIVDRNETVRRHGKQTIAWEGFYPEGKVEIPRNILVMAWAGGVWHRPDRLVEDGYTIINASCRPLYVDTKRQPPFGQWPLKEVYNWNMYRWKHPKPETPAYNGIQLSDTAPVVGAQLCSWNNPPDLVIPYLRKRLAAMSEKIWAPNLECGFDNFQSRLAVTDSRLERLLIKS